MIRKKLTKLLSDRNGAASRSDAVTDEVYEYVLDHSLRDSEILQALRAETSLDREADMQVGPDQGQFLGLLVKLVQAKTTIEVGVFTGYSTLCTALALPEDGKIIACDVDDAWTQVASQYWHKAGVLRKSNYTSLLLKKPLDPC